MRSLPSKTPTTEPLRPHFKGQKTNLYRQNDNNILSDKLMLFIFKSSFISNKDTPFDYFLLNIYATLLFFNS